MKRLPKEIEQKILENAQIKEVNKKALEQGKPEVLPDLALVISAVVNAGYPEPEHEFHFAKEALGRKWRFDCAWPQYKVALEREGGTWVRMPCKKCKFVTSKFVSRHHDRIGMEGDAEKYNSGAAMGWCVIRGTPQMMQDGRVLAALLFALNNRSEVTHDRQEDAKVDGK